VRLCAARHIYKHDHECESKGIEIMASPNRMLNDAARLAEGAFGTLAGVRREFEALARQQVERLMERMELVTRDEFDAVREMAANARAENEALAARLHALEAELKAAKKAPSRKKPAATHKAG
jgi:BMFP domain-containing protein YqiC